MTPHDAKLFLEIASAAAGVILLVVAGILLWVWSIARNLRRGREEDNR